MIIFKDIITGDEMFTDVYKYVEFDGIFYKVVAKYITKKVDSIDDAAIGGNASAEGGGEDEGADDSGTISGLDVVLANRLVETGFGKKKDYQVYMKDYMKKIMEKLSPDKLAEFKGAAQTAMKKMFDSFSDLQFFMGESMNPDGMHAIVRYEDEVPVMYFFKHGLEEEKV